MSETTVAARLAVRIAGVDERRLPEALRVTLEDLVLDVAGLCLAARGTDYVGAALAGWEAEGRATAFGHRRTLDPAGAAFVNGTAAHGEDFDDTFEGGPVHAGAVIVPAVLAAAERFGLSGADALRGIAVGVETICRLSLVAPKRVHGAGFHPTSVFGTLAAAAAVGSALRLEEAQLVHAFGLAGSMTGGIIEYLADGSWTKRLHPGWAAQGGMRAALLARAGFVGPVSVFEGTHGLFNGFARTREGDWGKLLDGFGADWVAATLAFKPYACGTMVHPYIDCARRLRDSGVVPEHVESIICEVAEGTVHRLWEPLALKQAPPNAYAAKFSSPFCIAAALVTGDAGLAAFDEARVADPRIRALAAKVRYVIDPANPYPANYTGHVRATLRDGSVREERQPHLRGGANERLPRDAIAAKFVGNAVFGGVPESRAEKIRTHLATLFAAPRINLTPLRIEEET